MEDREGLGEILRKGKLAKGAEIATMLWETSAVLYKQECQ